MQGRDVLWLLESDWQGSRLQVNTRCIWVRSVGGLILRGTVSTVNLATYVVGFRERRVDPHMLDCRISLALPSCPCTIVLL